MSIPSPDLPRSDIPRMQGGSLAPTRAVESKSGERQGATPATRSAGAWLQRRLAGLLGSRLFWVLFLIVAFGWPVSRVVSKAMPPHLPILGTVSPFELVDLGGRRYGTAELAGRVWLASVIRTTSPTAGALTTELVKVQHRVRNLGPAFHLVTIGGDAAVDTPEKLADFSSHHRVSPRRWAFLSGDADKVAKAKGALGVDAESGVPGGGAESARGSEASLTVTLVDAKLRIRGRYDLADERAIDTLLYHVGLLVNRGD